MAYYTTSTAVGALTGTTYTDSTVPTYQTVATFIKAASAEIEAYTGQTWSQASATGELLDTLYTDPPNLLFTKHSPIISVATFWINTGSVSNQTWSAQTENTDFTIQTDHILLTSWNWYNTGYRVARISYSYGQATTPDDIKLATTYLAAANALGTQDMSAIPDGLSEYQVGMARYKFSNIQDSIKAYRQLAYDILKQRGRKLGYVSF